MEKVKIKLNSTQVVVEVKVRVELGNIWIIVPYLESKTTRIGFNCQYRWQQLLWYRQTRGPRQKLYEREMSR